MRQACHEVSQLGTHEAGTAQESETCISNFLQSFQGSGSPEIPECLRLCPWPSMQAVASVVSSPPPALTPSPLPPLVTMCAVDVELVRTRETGGFHLHI